MGGIVRAARLETSSTWLQGSRGLWTRAKPRNITLTHRLNLASVLAAALIAGAVPVTTAASFDPSDLALNGRGVRSFFWRDINEVALYTPAPVRSWDSLWALPGPKRVRVRMLLREFTAEQFRASWREHFDRTLTVGARQALAPRVAEFLSAFEAVRRDDTLDFDCLPGLGLQVSVRGVARQLIVGEDFCPLVYSAWMGPQAHDRSLSAQLLAGGS